MTKNVPLWNLIVQAQIPPVLVEIVAKSGTCSGLDKTFPESIIATFKPPSSQLCTGTRTNLLPVD